MPIATGAAIIISGIAGSLIREFSNHLKQREGGREYKKEESLKAHQKEINEQNLKNQEKLHERMIAFQREVNERNIQLQRELNERNIVNSKEIAYFNALATRQTSVMVARENARNNFKNALIQDILKNFPLNISPLVILENNFKNIDFLLGQASSDSQEFILPSEKLNVIDSINQYKSNPLSLNIFIAPMHVDSRIGTKELICSQVWDTVYQNVESLFLKEYGRNSERPVTFYPTAWNKNTKPGLHASEMLFYFLKDMPSLVIEPRFDGKKLKIIFSSWGLGYTTQQHFRNEMAIDIDWLPLIVNATYERSLKMIEILGSFDGKENKVLTDKLQTAKQNVETYDKLRITEKISNNTINELDVLGDYSRLFYLDVNDVSPLSDLISSCIGITLAGIADVHHLLATEAKPKLPIILDTYFPKQVNRELASNFIQLYSQAYRRLSYEFPDLAAERTLECESTITPLKLIAGNNNQDKEDKIVSSLKTKCSLKGYIANDFDDAFSFLISKCDLEDIDYLNSLYSQLYGNKKFSDYASKIELKVNDLKRKEN
ncbi:MAG: hypothetical protein HXX16_10220 [Bacteroidales bacterium]|nr:hypothetical protein [Bacteroidales bacterium]